jgi:hypothetical protein
LWNTAGEKLEPVYLRETNFVKMAAGDQFQRWCFTHLGHELHLGCSINRCIDLRNKLHLCFAGFENPATADDSFRLRLEFSAHRPALHQQRDLSARA